MFFTWPICNVEVVQFFSLLTVITIDKILLEKKLKISDHANIILSDVSDSSIASGAALIKQTMVLIFEGLERLSAFQLGDVFP
jgi:hypothetical protein